MKENWLVGSRFVDTEMVQLHFFSFKLIFYIMSIAQRRNTRSIYFMLLHFTYLSELVSVIRNKLLCW